MGQIIHLHRVVLRPDLPSADFEQRESAGEWRRRLMSQSSYRPTPSDRLSDAAADLRDLWLDICDFNHVLTIGIVVGALGTFGLAYLWSLAL